jgi:regulator of replication initiation timing
MSITERAKDMGVEELVKENRKLKEENERLKIELDNNYGEFKADYEYIEELEIENKKLREELEWYKKQYEHSM